MGLKNKQLLNVLNELLKPEKVKDYCPNGLQVEGREQIKKIITGVTATQALIDEAINKGADAIFVHHGYFWKGENECIVGMKYKRLKALLENDINLYAYHLPLDIHPSLGNNAQLAKLLNINVTNGLDIGNPQSVAMQGQFNVELSVDELKVKINDVLQREPLVEAGGTHPIKTVAWCSGGGQGYIEQAAEQGIDAFITGEVSEQTIHTAREMGIHFFAAGHHATERYGAKAVGEHLAKQYNLDVEFVDIPNPA
ncbi:Nif3-like dinuclear metal center hexameric protein [Neptunicella marina]|uniref:GTP cyclohydrolase 1 type 2 homolog n=1 Tax=Neptunicella marina TaxID=2125989 RepID=A0A8J6ITX4_9ALTE|nr:Nif3-like dinuclear metal center hexameric protein [Neptunicella marina]MBC3767320.1 Nif3-like dinuclear metal center hexameric protein [Neptunicella marina]